MHEEPGRCADKLSCKFPCWQLRCGLREDKVLGEPCPHSPSTLELIKHLTKGGRPYLPHIYQGRQGMVFTAQGHIAATVREKWR